MKSHLWVDFKENDSGSGWFWEFHIISRLEAVTKIACTNMEAYLQYWNDFQREPHRVSASNGLTQGNAHNRRQCSRKFITQSVPMTDRAWSHSAATHSKRFSQIQQRVSHVPLLHYFLPSPLKTGSVLIIHHTIWAYMSVYTRLWHVFLRL